MPVAALRVRLSEMLWNTNCRAFQTISAIKQGPMRFRFAATVAAFGGKMREQSRPASFYLALVLAYSLRVGFIAHFSYDRGGSGVLTLVELLCPLTHFDRLRVSGAHVTHRWWAALVACYDGNAPVNSWSGPAVSDRLPSTEPLSVLPAAFFSPVCASPVVMYNRPAAIGMPVDAGSCPGGPPKGETIPLKRCDYLPYRCISEQVQQRGRVVHNVTVTAGAPPIPNPSSGLKSPASTISSR